MKTIYTLLASALLLAGCATHHPDIPTDAVLMKSLPQLLPDYTGCTIPVNIAPLNFMIDDTEVTHALVRIQGRETDLTFGGDDTRIIFDEKEWRQMLTSHAGDKLTCTLYTKKEGQWQQHPEFYIYVSPDTIDRYVSYRLIEPSYVSYEHLGIYQRNLTSFEESTILDNNSKQHKEHCLNCHSYQNYHTDNMLLHVRGKVGGGTMLVHNGKAEFHTDMRREGMMSNPVYPAWHPTLPLIAFSTNKTGQFFHLIDADKIEVQDTQSSLVLYNVEKDEMIALPSSPEDFDTFPTWSPDGRYLYYTSAHYERQDTTAMIDREIADNYTSLRYNIYRRAFNADSLCFGARELVLDVESQQKSATLPRISPDGTYMLFASGDFGCFHIWHSHADIWMLNLDNGEVNTLASVNSNKSESYPTWSSNGRWMLFASRRNDGCYSRIFMAHVDSNGVAGKAFEMPQKNPDDTRLLLKSYNRPEPMVEAAPKLK